MAFNSKHLERGLNGRFRQALIVFFYTRSRPVYDLLFRYAATRSSVFDTMTNETRTTREGIGKHSRMWRVPKITEPIECGKN